ncbi:hypothetical protein GCM10022206_85310 [Streptomyces chiangmaiensis]
MADSSDCLRGCGVLAGDGRNSPRSQGEVADDCGDFGVGDAGGPGGLERGLVDGAAASGYGGGEGKQGCRVRVG